MGGPLYRRHSGTSSHVHFRKDARLVSEEVEGGFSPFRRQPFDSPSLRVLPTNRRSIGASRLIHLRSIPTMSPLHLVKRKLKTFGLTALSCSNWLPISSAKIGVGIGPNVIRFRNGSCLKILPPLRSTWGEIFEP